MPFFRLNDIKLYYEIHGAGDPLLLIPGLGSDAATWINFLPLVDKDFRVILVENRGSGRSSKPADGYSTSAMAEDVFALLEHLEADRAHVIGKSMGGMIAQVLAARHPERIRSLVLVSSLMRHDDFGEELLELGRIMAQKGGLFATYRQAFLLSYSREFCMQNRSRLKEVQDLLIQMDSQELLRGYLGQSIACQQHDSRKFAPKIQAPTLVIVGKDDMITPPEASQELAAAIPGAELVIHPQGGHGFWREFPLEVNPIIHAFLLRH